MEKKVQTLRERLKDYEKNFVIENFDYRNHCGELADVFQMQADFDIEGLMDFWREKNRNEFFEIEHPILANKSFAIDSVQIGMANFLFMSDEEGLDVWILAQCEHCINMVIVEGMIYKNNYGNHKPILQKLEKLAEFERFEFLFEPKPFGFLLSQTRPYHFFYDQLKILVNLERLKPVSSAPSFFFPQCWEVVDQDKRVFLFPNTIGNNHLNSTKRETVRKLNESMESLVYRESIAEYNRVVGESERKFGLTLWVGITGQKRSWLQQVEGYVAIIRQLKQSFATIKVYVDGFTARDGETQKNAEDETICAQIIEAFIDSGNVEIISLIGRDYRTKICYCDTIDLFIANAGTGCLVPLRFNKKPGVLHSNTRLFAFPDDYPATVQRTEKRFTSDKQVDSRAKIDLLSYHIPWQHIFNLTVEVLKQTRSVNIRLLDVPPVAEVAKSYEAQEKVELSRVAPF